MSEIVPVQAVNVQNHSGTTMVKAMVRVHESGFMQQRVRVVLAAAQKNSGWVWAAVADGSHAVGLSTLPLRPL